MKKKLLAILVMFALIVSFKTVSNAIFAEEITISNITSTVKQNNSEAEKNENNEYLAKFNSETTPYKEYVVELTISTTPTDFINLTTDEKNAIYNTIGAGWEINDEPIVFDNGEYITTEFEAKIENGALKFTPCVPKRWEIKVSADSASCTTVIISEHAEPSSITIEGDQPFTQKYEEFQPITLTATLNPNNFVDTTYSWTYVWSLNSVEIQKSYSNTLTLTQELLPLITTYTIEVTLAEKTTAYGKQEITITTDLDYTLTLTHSGGSLEQVLGENTEAIHFNAFLPIDDTYTMNWYLKTPSSASYTKLQNSGMSHTFNPLDYISKPGEYKIFAEAIYKNKILVSERYLINLKAKEITTSVSLKITTQLVANTKTANVEAYTLSVDTNGEYKENQLVWLVNNSKMAIGKSFTFEPDSATTYFIDVKLINPDGTINNTPITETMHLKVENISTVNYALILTISGFLLIGLFVGIILISNKTREKIW